MVLEVENEASLIPASQWPIGAQGDSKSVLRTKRNADCDLRNSLGVVLVLAHSLATPAHQRQIPHLQRLLEHGDGEESRVVKVVRLGIRLPVPRGMFGLIEPVCQLLLKGTQSSLRCQLGEVDLSVHWLLEEVVQTVLGACGVSKAVPSDTPSSSAARSSSLYLHSCEPGSCLS